MTRSAEITRKTGETDVTLSVGLDGAGAGTRVTGVGFLDHMLDLLARHGRLAPHVGNIARAEGFPVHGESAEARLKR